MVYAMANNARPNAKATPKYPMWLPASTALPTPPKTKTNVPTTSARYFFIGVSSSKQSPEVYHDYMPTEMNNSRHSRRLGKKQFAIFWDNGLTFTPPIL
jgi:hypothetical protein